jgi:hypothetical protein
MMNLLDPTIATEREHIAYVPRPANLKRLRVGVIENTRKNSETLLRKLVEKLGRDYGMTLEILVHKHQRAPLKDEQLQELKGRIDFAISGVGD